MIKIFNFKIPRLFAILFLVVGTVVCDQYTKVLAREYLQSAVPHSYFGGILTFLHSQNRGAFLSLGAAMNEDTRFWIFTVAVAAVLIGVLYGLMRKSSTFDSGSTLALSLIAGGGIGNLIDRITEGSVTDFIHLGVGPLQTGIFNVADMAITFGAIFLLIISFVQKPGGPLRP